MNNSRIRKQDAAEATRTALDSLYEVRTLGEIVNLVQYGDDSDDEIAQNQLFVLQNITNEKMHQLFHALDFTNDYFLQQPRKTRKKKLAIVKKAA